MTADDIQRLPSASSPGDDAYEAIRRAIVDGTLKPGQRVIEQQLAKMMNVSRTPVREALFKLERENLVARSGRGMAVRSFSSEEVRDIYDMRAVLEGYGARLACRRIHETEVALLEQIQTELEQTFSDAGSAQVSARDRLNQKFHRVVVHAARSPSLERCLAQVIQLPLLYKAYVWYDEDATRRSADGHRDLIRLLGSRDEGVAEEHWRRHIEFGRDILAARLADQEASLQ
jgi:DNA-binding GntR family transcriptional regulator